MQGQLSCYSVQKEARPAFPGPAKGGAGPAWSPDFISHSFSEPSVVTWVTDTNTNPSCSWPMDPDKAVGSSLGEVTSWFWVKAMDTQVGMVLMGVWLLDTPSQGNDAPRWLTPSEWDHIRWDVVPSLPAGP